MSELFWASLHGIGELARTKRFPRINQKQRGRARGVASLRLCCYKETTSRGAATWMIERSEVPMKERNVPTIQETERRAYEIYLARGGEDGRAVEDWLAAERELTESSEQSVPATPRTRAAGSSI